MKRNNLQEQVVGLETEKLHLEDKVERLNRTNNEIFKANETLAKEIKKLQNQLQQKENIIKEVRETLINSKEYKMAKEMNLTSKMSVLIELLEILYKGE